MTYYRDICRVNVDTGELNTLCEGDLDITHHQQGAVSPRGQYLVATASGLTRGFVLDRHGQRLMELVTTDITLPEGWCWPEPLRSGRR